MYFYYVALTLHIRRNKCLTLLCFHAVTVENQVTVRLKECQHVRLKECQHALLVKGRHCASRQGLTVRCEPRTLAAPLVWVLT